MARKKSELQKAKEKAWVAYSKYIRTRDCIRFTGDPDNGMCVSCGKAYPYKRLQAGHFIGGRTNNVLFDEKITYSQCYGCNVGKGGNYLEYYYFMVKEMGSHEAVEQYRNAVKQRVIKYKLHDYLELAEYYDHRTKEVLLTPPQEEDVSVFTKE